MEKTADWFYRVKEKIGAYDRGDDHIRDYEYIKDFRNADLPLLRQQAIEYFNQRGTSLPERLRYPFISSDLPAGSGRGEYSAELSFVCWYSDHDFEENVIAGNDQEDNTNGMDVEAIVWKELGFSAPAPIVAIPVDES